MNWKKYIQLDVQKNMDFLIVGIIILSLISFIFKRPILFVIVGIFIVYLLVNTLYERSIGKKLHLENTRTITRAFPGEEVSLEVLLTNYSHIPYINGEIELSINDVVSTDVHESMLVGERSRILIPTSIMGKRKTRINISLQAEKRGVARIYHLMYTFPHLINFEKVMLTYGPFLQREIVVFPEMKEVAGMEQLRQHLPGEQRIRFSPYEDIQSIIGTRSYVPSDPFHRINWNATVKTGEMQTNEYERVIDRSFFFIVNIQVKQLRVDRLEDFLSYMAYLVNDVNAQGLPYEMVVNARKLGSVPFVHQKQGEGNAHVIQTLDILARIDRHGVSTKITQVMLQMREQLARAHTIIYIGELSAEEQMILRKIVGTNKPVLHVDHTGELKKLAKEVMNHAT